MGKESEVRQVGQESKGARCLESNNNKEVPSVASEDDDTLANQRWSVHSASSFLEESVIGTKLGLGPCLPTVTEGGIIKSSWAASLLVLFSSLINVYSLCSPHLRDPTSSKPWRPRPLTRQVTAKGYSHFLRSCVHSCLGLKVDHLVLRNPVSSSLYPTQALLEPYTYICSNPGKEMRTELISAFNAWIKVPTEELAIITKVVKMLHTASLLYVPLAGSPLYFPQCSVVCSHTNPFLFLCMFVSPGLMTLKMILFCDEASQVKALFEALCREVYRLHLIQRRLETTQGIVCKDYCSPLSPCDCLHMG